MLFLLVYIKKYVSNMNKLIAFLIVLIFQYFNFNVAMLTKTLTGFEEYCNSKVFVMAFLNTVFSLLLFILLIKEEKKIN